MEEECKHEWDGWFEVLLGEGYFRECLLCGEKEFTKERPDKVIGGGFV